MKEALPKLSQKTLTGSPSVIFSLVSAAGLSRSDLREFRKIRLSGREARLANRLARQGSNSDSSTRDTSRQYSSTSSASAALQSSLGEQVAPAIAKSWMCDLQTHLEGEDYAVGFAVLPACSVGAPHKRERLFFGAHELAEANNARPQRREGMPECAYQQPVGAGSVESELAYSSQCGRRKERENTRGVAIRDSEEGRASGRSASCCNNTANPHHGFWSDADWLGCRDGKFRPVESSTFPLANGIPARVGRLRGYGNAIVPQVAAEFIKAFMGAVNE